MSNKGNGAMRSGVASAIAVLAVLSAVQGCTSSGGEETNPESAAQEVRTAQPPANQPEGAAKDLREVKCAADSGSGEWSFSAKLSNTSDKPSEYTVRVHVVKKQGSTVVGSHEIKQKVDPGKTVDIKQDRFAKPEEAAAQLQCVPTTTVARG